MFAICFVLIPTGVFALKPRKFAVLWVILSLPCHFCLPNDHSALLISNVHDAVSWSMPCCPTLPPSSTVQWRYVERYMIMWRPCSLRSYGLCERAHQKALINAMSQAVSYRFCLIPLSISISLYHQLTHFFMLYEISEMMWLTISRWTLGSVLFLSSWAVMMGPITYCKLPFCILHINYSWSAILLLSQGSLDNDLPTLVTHCPIFELSHECICH
jgi:hypothetical protein